MADAEFRIDPAWHPNADGDFSMRHSLLYEFLITEGSRPVYPDKWRCRERTLPGGNLRQVRARGSLIFSSGHRRDAYATLDSAMFRILWQVLVPKESVTEDLKENR